MKMILSTSFDLFNSIVSRLFFFLLLLYEKDIINCRIVNNIIAATDEISTKKISEVVIDKVDSVILNMEKILVQKKIESNASFFLKVCEVCLADIFVCSLLKIEEKKYYNIFFEGIIKAQTIDDFTMNRLLFVTKTLNVKEKYTLLDVSYFEKTVSEVLVERLNGEYDHSNNASLNIEIEKYLLYCKKYFDIF